MGFGFVVYCPHIYIAVTEGVNEAPGWGFADAESPTITPPKAKDKVNIKRVTAAMMFLKLIFIFRLKEIISQPWRKAAYFAIKK